jgi:hypothetical protein
MFACCKSKRAVVHPNDATNVDIYEDINPSLFAEILKKLQEQYENLKASFD